MPMQGKNRESRHNSDSIMRKIGLKTGLSLAILLVFGMVYGYISSVHNQNPYYPIPGIDKVPNEKRVDAWHWEPSPLWLPSYLLCKVPKNGFAITYTKSGYFFRSYFDLYLYRFSSTILGGCFSLLIAIIITNLKKVKRKKKKAQSEGILAPPCT